MGCGASAVPPSASTVSPNGATIQVDPEAAVSSTVAPPPAEILEQPPAPPTPASGKFPLSRYLTRSRGGGEDAAAAGLRGRLALERAIWALATSAMKEVWPLCVHNAFDDFDLLEDFSVGSLSANRMRSGLHSAVPELRPLTASESLRASFRDDVASLASLEASLAPDADAWEAFARRCLESIFLELFELVCGGSDGKLKAQDVMIVLELLSQQQSGEESLTYAQAEQIVREFDVACDGVLSQEEFLGMVRTLEPRYDDTELAAPDLIPPHLLLHMDVNNTVLIADSVSNQSAVKLITLTISSYAWGTMTRGGSGKPSWLLVCKQPSMLPPWDGLVSYADFVTKQNPFPEKADYYVKEEIRKTRRALMHSFTDKGAPGEQLRPWVDKLVAALELRPDMVGTEDAMRAGLKTNTVQLLPSFLHLLRELKRQGRSFTLIFRSFGTDLGEHIQAELNALCEGRHPLFADEPHLVLDGSDGEPDYRMNLSDASSLGTFFRSPDNGDISLVWGSHEQPKPGQGLSFYDGRLPDGCHACEGVRAAAASLEESVLRRSSHSTIVLRDYYPGWAKADFRGDGGKPIFLNVKDHEVLPIFFDDHLRPVNPTIVDAVDVATFPARIPMQQVYNRHLVRASPLRSIVERNYFVDEIARCEREKAAQLKLWRKVGRLLHDPAALVAVIELLAATTEEDDVDELMEPGMNVEQALDAENAADDDASRAVTSGEPAMGQQPAVSTQAFSPRAPSIHSRAPSKHSGAAAGVDNESAGLLSRQVSGDSSARLSGVLRAKRRHSTRKASKSQLFSQSVHYTSWRDTGEVRASQNLKFTDFETIPDGQEGQSRSPSPHPDQVHADKAAELPVRAFTKA